MNCVRCGHFLQKDESLLCERCYEEFWKFLERNWRRLSKNRKGIEADLMGIWLEEVKKHD